MMSRAEEAERATAMLKGRTVKRVVCHREQEVLIELDDGTRLFAESEMPLELSVTLAG
jgi:hypothetical protein